jgi:hypothetical protein
MRGCLDSGFDGTTARRLGGAPPIGRRAINPDQPNRAYDILEPKFRRGPAGWVKGFGLKNFP